MILKSCLDDRNDHIESSLFQENIKEQRFYTKYKFELSDLRILYSDSSISTLFNYSLNLLFLIDKKRLYILRRTPLIDITFYKCIYSNDANLTK